MAVRNNPVLGTLECGDCQGTATVHRTKRGKGRYFYTRCPNCGPDQRPGKAVQERILAGVVWRDNAAEVDPEVADLIAGNAEPDWRPGQPAEQEAVEPKPAPVSEPKPEPKPESRKPKAEPSGGYVLAGIALLSIVGGGLLAFAKRQPKPQQQVSYGYQRY